MCLSVHAPPAAAGVKKRLTELNDLVGDPDLEKSASFLEMREACRSCGNKTTTRVTKRGTFFMALRAMLADIADGANPKLPNVDHVFQWYSNKKREMPTEAQEMKLDMDRLENVPDENDWVGQMSHRPPVLAVQRAVAVQPAIKHASLERLTGYQTRDLIDAYAHRTGVPLNSVVKGSTLIRRVRSFCCFSHATTCSLGQK